jgi:hypothetical protein
MAAVLQEDDEFLSPFETAFVRAVLEYRGVRRRPTLAEFRAALETMSAYTQQCEDNPPDPTIKAWLHGLAENEHAEMVARAFLEFGATKPTQQQWHRVHQVVFGPLVCSTCE